MPNRSEPKDGPDAAIHEVLSLVRKIEQRLVGGLDSDSPGLISEVNKLKEDAIEHSKDIHELRNTVVSLNQLTREATITIQNLTSELKAVQETIATLTKYRWIAYGILIGIGGLISHLDKIVTFGLKIFSNGAKP